MAFTFAVGVAAINTGNNLMYLILSMMLALMVLSGILSENILKSIRVERRTPLEVWAGAPFVMEYEVLNPKRFFPSYALRIKEKNVKALREPFIFKLSAGAEKTAKGEFIVEKRGWLEFEQIIISTRFPFGLFEKAKLVWKRDKVLVFPRAVPVENEKAELEKNKWEQMSNKKGEGDGLFGIREYVDGDNPRKIHWKVSAKAGKLMMKETEAMETPKISILLDVSRYFERKDNNLLESAIGKCAWLARSYIEKDFLVRLILPPEDTSYGSGAAHLKRILTALALFEPTQEIPSLSFTPGEDEHIVIEV